MLKPESNLKNQAAYRERMSATHIKRHVWIPKTTLKQLEILAKETGWLASTGRNAGEVNYQQTINEVLQAGLRVLSSK